MNRLLYAASVAVWFVILTGAFVVIVIIGILPHDWIIHLEHWVRRRLGDRTA